jgi:nucleotide-binding universal stress UspA family protein
MYRKILAPTDGSASSTRAVAEAARLARALRASLLILHVRSPVEIPHHPEGGALSRLGEKSILGEIELEERQLLDAAVEIAHSIGVKAEAAFISDELPYEAIVRVSQEQSCDLVVMASRIRHRISEFLIESETQKVLTHSATPVLVVR